MSYKLIIVDDEKEISSGFAQFFPWGSLGFEVTAQFADAQKAFDYLKKNPVDVVVSDIIMPGMTGLELAKMISETELLIQPHVILFSAYDNFEFARKALRYKCTEYILKSSEYDELIEIFTHLKQTMDQERGSGTSGSDAGEEVLLPVSVCNDKIISAIINYITKEPATADLEGAAAAVYMSTAYISRYFKQKTGLNFSDYLLSTKMQLAADLLMNLQFKIYEISDRLGYKNPANFTRSFKRIYQISPKDYRFQKMGRVHPEDEEELD
jgi:two-component system response regulator YesN